MKHIIKKTWKWGLLATLPATIFCLLWLINIVETYYKFGLKYNSGAVQIKLLETADMEFSNLWRSLILSFSTQERVRNAPHLKEIDLFVPESDISRLNEDLPYSGYEYVEGTLAYGPKQEKIKVRYRGDYPYHWAFDKKSFRVKTKKDKLYEGLNKFNLIVPKGTEQVNEYLAYHLANLLGLMTPKVEMVNLTLNGRRQGIYLFVEQLEELTLRRNGRMPGDLYVGELLEKDYYNGAGNNLFLQPSLWSKAAVNNHYPEEAYEPLKALIAAIQNNGADLSEILSIEEWARFSIFETLCQTIHYDTTHNWRLYYDPAKGVFSPVVWDPMGWISEVMELEKTDIIQSDMHEALFRSPDFLLARHESMRKFFSQGLDKKLLSEFDAITKKIIPSISGDCRIVVSEKPLTNNVSHQNSNNGFYQFRPWPQYPFRLAQPSEIIKKIKKLRIRIEENFEKIRHDFLDVKRPVFYSLPEKKSVDFAFSGRQPLYKIKFTFDSSIPDLHEFSLFFKGGGTDNTIDISQHIFARGNTIEIDSRILPDMVTKHAALSIEETRFRVSIESIPENATLVDVSVSRDGQTFERAQKVDSLPLTPIKISSPLVDSGYHGLPVVWDVEQRIGGIREIYSDLIIRPGTTVRLEPGATVVVTGRLMAEGTAEAPIRFLPASEGQEPWGAIVLKGEGSNGSRLSYCEFEGGSGLKGDLFEYSAMFSVHDVKGVEVEHCRFSDSRETDDMVHAVYSEIRFSDSVFFRSKADALDLDISKGVVERCRFIDSGNDALDLMTTKAVVLDTELRNSGDKGISVGEGSTLLAMNDRFVGNVIGVQAKDGSVATLYNVDLAGNSKALDAYKKNWRYNDGGRIFLYKGRFVENTEMVTADKKSQIRLYDSYTDREIVAKKKRIRIDETVDSGVMTKARQAALWRDPDEVKRLSAIDERHWSSARPEARGASLGR